MYKKTVPFILGIILLSQFCLAQNFNDLEVKAIKEFNYQVTTASRSEGLKVLKNTSQSININDTLLPELVSQLLRMVAQEEGVGIAAPQIGINRQVFIIQRFDLDGEPFEEIINPEILWTSQLMQLGAEGCLSILDFRNDIWRHYAIYVKYQTLSGQTKFQHLEGFTAVIFQHEYDHLIGRLITDDYHNDLKKQMTIVSDTHGILKP